MSEVAMVHVISCRLVAAVINVNVGMSLVHSVAEYFMRVCYAVLVLFG